MHDRRFILKSLGSLAGLAAVGHANAQATAFPSRMIKIIASSAPASPTDVMGRLVAEVLSAKYNQNVIVDNRPGAGGLIGMQAAAASSADGYTLATGGLGNP